VETTTLILEVGSDFGFRRLREPLEPDDEFERGPREAIFDEEPSEGMLRMDK
jgi:hypothetical protein